MEFGINCTALDQSKLSNFVECTIIIIIVIIIIIIIIIITIISRVHIAAIQEVEMIMIRTPYKLFA